MMPKRIANRNDVAHVLTAWHGGRISPQEVQNRAGANFANDDLDYEDWEAEEQNSVTKEVIAALDMLDMNLMLPQDMPIYLEFLSTPAANLKTVIDAGKVNLMQLIMKAGGRNLKRIRCMLPFSSENNRPFTMAKLSYAKQRFSHVSPRR